MSQMLSPSTSRSYGLARVTRAWNISRAGVYRFRKASGSPTLICRRGPTGACLDAELAVHIRRQIVGSGFHGEGYRKIWARLRFAGVRASPRRVRRVMGEHGLLAPHRTGRCNEKALIALFVEIGYQAGCRSVRHGSSPWTQQRLRFGLVRSRR
jgi:hypothetical protein